MKLLRELLNESLGETPLSKVKGPIPILVQDVDMNLKLTRNRNAKGAFNVSIEGGGKKTRVFGGASGSLTVNEIIKIVNKSTESAPVRPKIHLKNQ